MKSIYIKIFLLFFISTAAFSQKYDYQWPMGYDAGSDIIPDISLLDFSGDTVEVYEYSFVDSVGFGASGSFICDEEGQLILMTNNCAVYDKDFFLVPNSDTLTPGSGYDIHCENQSYGGYTGYQTTVFLPQMNNDSIFYLLHKDNIYLDSLQEVLSTKLYLSTIIKKEDESFYLKEKRQLLNGFFNYGRLTACLHADGDKWWVNMVELNTNRFHKFLVGGQDTVQGAFVQEVGEALINQEIDVGQATYSPGASMFAFHASEGNKVILYNFDNLTGELSNYRELPYPAGEGENARGLAFSFDSRFIYATTSSDDLYQIDLEDESAIHIAHHESLDEDNWPVGIGNMYLGPDCRIYISPRSTTYYIHVIHRPNEKGVDCGFEARALRSPANISHTTLNLPMYRFDGACDSTIQFPFVDTVSAAVEVVEVGNVEIYPNPFRDYFTVTFTDRMPQQATIFLFDNFGRLCIERSLPAATNVFEVGSLSPGIYFYEIWEKGKRLGKGKLLKLE